MLTPILRLLATYLAVGLAVFAFFNRDRLAGMMGWGGNEAPAVVAAAEPEPGPEAAPAPSPAPATPVFAPPPGDNGVPEAPVVAETPAPAPAPAPALQIPTPPAGASTAGVLQTPTPPASAPAAVQAPTPPAAAPAAAPQNAPADSFEQQIAAARAAYWQGDVPTAIARYGDLLKEYPDSETLHGELGNIHYMNGNRVEAATHYEAAGMAALRAGNRQQAQMLLGVLGALDRAAAARLQTAMEESR